MGEKVYKVNSAASGVIAVVLGLLFGAFGAFFAWWLIAKFSFGRALVKSLIFLVLQIVGAMTSIFIIGWFILFISWIVMLVMLYRDCANTEITLGRIANEHN